MRKLIILTILITLTSCSNKILKYGYLPGIKYPIYKLDSKIDLNKNKINLDFIDLRNNDIYLSCSNISPERDSELEGKIGFDYFKKYFIETINNSNGIVANEGERVQVILEILSPKLIGFGYIKIHGLCQVSIISDKIEKKYCVDIKDGDVNSPLKWYSFTTRKTGLRKMTSAAIKQCIEEFLIDYNNIMAK